VDEVRGEGQTLHMPTAPRTAARILSVARLISLTGSTAAFTALFYTIYHRTGSAAWLSATLLLTFGVSGLIAPAAGILGDRFDGKRLMILSDLGGAVCFGAMALAHDPALLLAGGSSPPLRSRRFGRRPERRSRTSFRRRTSHGRTACSRRAATRGS